MTTRRDTAAAERVVDGNREIATKKNYEGKMRIVCEYLSNSHPDCIGHDGKIVLPLSLPVVVAIFGWLSINTDLPRAKKGEKQLRKQVTGGRQLMPDTEDESDEDDDEDEDMTNVEGVIGILRHARGSDSTAPVAAEEGMNMFEFADDQRTISASCMGGYKSAIKWYYDTKGVRMDDDTDKWIDGFIKGYKKQVSCVLYV